MQEDSFPGGFNVPRDRTADAVTCEHLGRRRGVIAVVAICATATGLLAPVGAAIGVVATLASLIGLRTTGQHLAGHGLAIVGVFVGLAAIVIGAFAVTRHYAWPNSTIDEIARWHAWLIARWPWRATDWPASGLGRPDPASEQVRRIGSQPTCVVGLRHGCGVGERPRFPSPTAWPHGRRPTQPHHWCCSFPSRARWFPCRLRSI